MMPMQASAAVTSVVVQRASAGVWRRSQARSRTAEAAAVTTRKASLARRVIVTSASMPPRAFNHCATGQRLGDFRGIGLTVGGNEDAADDALGVEERVLGGGFLGGEDDDLETEGARHRRAAMQLLEALVGQGDAERAVLLQPGGDAGFGLEPGVELLGVLGEARQVLGRPELPDQAGRVPCRAAGELPALDEDYVASAEPRQVIGNRAANDAAPDDDGPGIRGKVGHAGNSLLRIPVADGRFRRAAAARQARPRGAASRTGWRRR
jgi:hypothetical protein